MARKVSTDSVPDLEALETLDKTEQPLVDTAKLKEMIPEKPIPARLDVKWSDWLMTQFDSSELVSKEENGRTQKFPRCHGLRRLAQMYVGEIVESIASCVGAPKTLDNGGVDFAAFIYTVKFKKTTVPDHNGNYEYVTYSDGADVYYANDVSNNSDMHYARFPTALAITRAESRCLRKALGLTTCSAEELAPNLTSKSLVTPKQVEKTVNPEEYHPEYMDAGQLQFINIHSARININPWNLLNSGKNKYPDLSKVPFEWAQEVCKILGDMGRSKNNKGDYIEKYALEHNVDLGTFSKTWREEI